jgi:hypothetical protein
MKNILDVLYFGLINFLYKELELGASGNDAEILETIYQSSPRFITEFQNIK